VCVQNTTGGENMAMQQNQQAAESWGASDGVPVIFMGLGEHYGS
jgi:hypothetical protein